MFGRLSKLFHLQTAEELRELDTHKDSSLWPAEWKRIEFKSYPRMPQLALDPSEKSLGEISELIKKRKSSHEFEATPITLQEISLLLKYGAGLTENIDTPEKSRRSYPSGGARYPLEFYLVLEKVTGIEDGIYHYNVKDHSLEKLLGAEYLPEIRKSFSTPWIRQAPVVCIVTSVWERNFMKYRDFGYRLILLEAGHASQNFQLISTALSIKCSSVASFYVSKAARTLDLDPLVEAPIHALVFGK